jgi:hypothetical protein
MKRYPARDRKGRYQKYYYIDIRVIFAILALGVLAWALLVIREANQPLLSPLGEDVVETVHAEEKTEKKEEYWVSCEDPAGYIKCKFYDKTISETEAITLYGIAVAESSLNPLAKNPRSTATGLFQHIDSTWKHYNCAGERTNFKDSTNCAIRMLRQDGRRGKNAFKHWEVYNNGAYLKFAKEELLFTEYNKTIK